MSTVADHYQMLGVARNATSSDIKKAYRKLALKYHPDKNKQLGAEDLFKRIGESYTVLSDPTKKLAYDAKLKTQIYTKPAYSKFTTTTTTTYSTYSAPTYDFDTYRQTYTGFKQETHSRTEETKRKKREAEERATREAEEKAKQQQQRAKSRNYNKTYDWNSTGGNPYYYNLYEDGIDPSSTYRSTGTRHSGMNNQSFERNKPRKTQQQQGPTSSSNSTSNSNSIPEDMPSFMDPKPDIKSTNDGNWSKSKYSYSYKSGEKTYTGKTPYVRPPLQKNTYSHKQPNFSAADEFSFEYRYDIDSQDENEEGSDGGNEPDSSSDNDNDNDDGDDRASYFEESSFRGFFGQSNSSADESDGPIYTEVHDNPSEFQQDATNDSNIHDNPIETHQDETNTSSSPNKEKFNAPKQHPTKSTASFFFGGLGTEQDPIELESGSEKNPVDIEENFKSSSPLRKTKRKIPSRKDHSRYWNPLGSPSKKTPSPVKSEKVPSSTKFAEPPGESSEAESQHIDSVEATTFETSSGKRRKTRSNDSTRKKAKVDGLNNMQDLNEELPSSTFGNNSEYTNVPQENHEAETLEQPEIIELSEEDEVVPPPNGSPEAEQLQQQQQGHEQGQEQEQKGKQTQEKEQERSHKQPDHFTFEDVFKIPPFTETNGNFNMDSINDFISKEKNEKVDSKLHSTSSKHNRDEDEMDMEEDENEFSHKASVNADPSEIPIHRPVNQPLPRRKKVRRAISKDVLGVTDEIIGTIRMKASEFVQFEESDSTQLRVGKYKNYMMKAIQFDLVMTDYFKIRRERDALYLEKILLDGSRADKEVYFEVTKIDSEVMGNWNQVKEYQQQIMLELSK